MYVAGEKQTNNIKNRKIKRKETEFDDKFLYTKTMSFQILPERSIQTDFGFVHLVVMSKTCL